MSSYNLGTKNAHFIILFGDSDVAYFIILPTIIQQYQARSILPNHASIIHFARRSSSILFLACVSITRQFSWNSAPTEFFRVTSLTTGTLLCSHRTLCSFFFFVTHCTVSAVHAYLLYHSDWNNYNYKLAQSWVPDRFVGFFVCACLCVCFIVWGIDSRALCIPGKLFITELHLQSLVVLFW